MEFHEFVPLYSAMKRISPEFIKRYEPEQYYLSLISQAEQMARRSGGLDHKQGNIETNRFVMEFQWIRDRRPYYNVWPSIIPCLLKLSLDFDSGYVKPPLEILCIRLPKEKNPMVFEFAGQEHKIRTIMLANAEIRGERGISVWIDIGELEVPPNPVPMLTFQNIQCRQGHSLEESLLNLPRHSSVNEGIQIPWETLVDCIRLCCTLCLLENDASIVEPDVLAADRDKFERTGDQKYVEKARRRSKLGWNIGRNIEVVPHIRGPSPAALYWTGKGRTVPIIRFRKGCVVHRKAIGEIPTGFMGEMDE